MSFPINIPEYEVSEFNKAIKEVIENNFNYVRVKGEISELKKATRGQLYLTLKDNNSILSGVIWDNKKNYLNIVPEVGMEVILTGKVTTWSKFKTTYQIDIDGIEIAGEGALLKLIEERKKRLEKKGYFKIENKKPIPFLPNKIGVITSPTGSVIHDIINRIKDRFPLPIDVWAVSVQGLDSAKSIIQAIEGFNNMPNYEKPDVIIIARGGGSTEDLMAFNEETLAITVFNSSIPIISAIGHETDNTIVDFVSDLRASTPTAAAERAVPVRDDLNQSVSSLNHRLNHFMINKLKYNFNNLNNYKKILKAPNEVIKVFSEKLNKNVLTLNFNMEKQFSDKKIIINNINSKLRIPDNLISLKISVIKNCEKYIIKSIDQNFKKNKERFSKLSRLLTSNSVASNLKKGYSILMKDNIILKDIKKINKKDKIYAKMHKGSLDLEVKEIN